MGKRESEEYVQMILMVSSVLIPKGLQGMTKLCP